MITGRESFEMLQLLRRGHCDRKGQEHACVGVVTIKQGEVCLNCPLCGTGEDIPGWSSDIAEKLSKVMDAAGINWDSLNMDSKRAAVEKFREVTK